MLAINWMDLRALTIYAVLLTIIFIAILYGDKK